MAIDSRFSKDPTGKRTVCIDFDGVVHKYSKGYYDGTIYDVPTQGVKEALKFLSEHYKLVLFTARIVVFENGLEDTIRWLKKYDLYRYFSDITATKIPAIAYIDDNAIKFKGDWKETILELFRKQLESKGD